MSWQNSAAGNKSMDSHTYNNRMKVPGSYFWEQGLDLSCWRIHSMNFIQQGYPRFSFRQFSTFGHSDAKVQKKNKEGPRRMDYSDAQKAVMDEMFRTNPYPSKAQKLFVVNRTGLTEQQVVNWFQNRRNKEKKLQQMIRCATQYWSQQGQNLAIVPSNNNS